MSKYLIEYKKSADKDLRKIPRSELKAVFKRIASLSDDPRAYGAIKLQGNEELYRVRQGDYRIIYSIDDGTVTVLVVKIGHRKEIYGR